MVVVAAQSKPKTGGYELQLPSMGSLTSKTSSQAFFLRILKVILQLRDAARLAAVKAKRKQVEAAAPVAGAAPPTPAAGTASTVTSEPSVASASGAEASASAASASVDHAEATATVDATNEIPAPMEVDIFNCICFIILPNILLINRSTKWAITRKSSCLV